MLGISSYKVKQVKNILDNKLKVDWEPGGKELRGYYYVDGVKTLRVFMPKKHGGGQGDCLSHNVLKQLKNSLKLNSQEFGDLYNCPMSGSKYEAKIRSIPNLT